MGDGIGFTTIHRGLLGFMLPDLLPVLALGLATAVVLWLVLIGRDSRA